jgi:hypothetical protein
MFFYTDTGPRTPVDLGFLARLDPNTQYEKHLQNWFYLKFIIMNSNNFQEKAQATKELAICDRKLSYWKRNPRFDHKRMISDTEALKKKWNMQ